AFRYLGGGATYIYAALGAGGGANNAVYRCENPRDPTQPIWFVGNGNYPDAITVHSLTDSRSSTEFPNPFSVNGYFPNNAVMKIATDGNQFLPGGVSGATIYVAITNPIGNGLYTIQKSTDGGQSWGTVGTGAATPNYLGNQGNFDSAIAIVPGTNG